MIDIRRQKKGKTTIDITFIYIKNLSFSLQFDLLEVNWLTMVAWSYGAMMDGIRFVMKISMIWMQPLYAELLVT